MTATRYTARVRARATAYALGILRGDSAAGEALADLTEDELQATVEALALQTAAALNQASGGRAEEVLIETLRNLKTEEFQQMTEDNE